MASNRPAWWPVYALASTLGSVAGAYILYGIARGGGEFIWRKTPPEAMARARRWLERNEFVSVLVASILPPPAPLKISLLTAGVLRVNPFYFGLALLVGRGLRFGADAWLGARYGLAAQDYLRHNLAWASLAAIAIIVGLALFARWSVKFGTRASGLGTRD
jgi:membrane protein YqaA with SNARE-associated domain